MYDWKYKVWITLIVIFAIGLLGVFTYQAVVDFGKSIVIMPAHEVEAMSLK